jgi:hypothetical protein
MSIEPVLDILYPDFCLKSLAKLFEMLITNFQTGKHLLTPEYIEFITDIVSNPIHRELNVYNS